MLRFSTTIPTSLIPLLDTTRGIKYGELFSVEVELTAKRTPMELSQNEADLVDFIENGGHQKIDVLTVHQGEPVMAECDVKTNGFHCRKKTKFPAGKTEG